MSGRPNPRHIAAPIAQVLYPAKSQKICPANATAPTHALTNVYPSAVRATAPAGPGSPNAAFAAGASRASATTTFSNSPTTSRLRPHPNCAAVARRGRASCGRKSAARTIGPATNCGKKLTNRAKSRKLPHGAACRRYTSIV